MTATRRRRALVRNVIALAAAITVCSTVPGVAGRKRPRRATISVETPLGLQGRRSAGERVAIVFHLADRRRRRLIVDVEYGWDVNGDGVVNGGSDGHISGLPSEYYPATIAADDPRDTGTTRRRRRDRSRLQRVFGASRSGAAQIVVWDSLRDIGRYPILFGPVPLRTPQGRTIPDPDNSPGSVLVRCTSLGVVMRMRARRIGRRSPRSDWAYAHPFSIDNMSVPSAEIEAIGAVELPDGVVAIDWRAFHDDSEDKDGDGVLDLRDLEDWNGNGLLDALPVAVAFDHHRIQPGETIPELEHELAELDWWPCTRASDRGDPDDGVPSAPTGVGRAATFVWDLAFDRGLAVDAEGEYLVRATPYDGANVGAPVYRLTSVAIPADR